VSAEKRIIYFDHAATSWPKPPEVVAAMVAAMADAGGNPGRGAHQLSVAAARVIASARSAAASLLGVPDERDIIFTAGCTPAMNLALKGALEPGDRVVVSGVEHNAVVRPLAALAEVGVEVVIVPADREGRIDPDDVERLVSERPTRAVVCQHASNVTGVIHPIGDLADIAHEHGAVMLVDGAQAGGHLAVDVTALGVDAYACSGHKGLLGPQGVGLLYLAPGFEPRELIQGGGGTDPIQAGQPGTRPDRYEAGTVNTPGVAGLGAAMRLLLARGDEIRAEERALTRRLHEGLLGMPGIRVLGPPPAERRVPVVSVVHERVAPDEIAYALERRARIAVRAGLHCNPWTHEAVGTTATGAVRFGLGFGVTGEDVEVAIATMREICA
jgi:cysteine desulfurase family protein